jgi:DNA mismatch repair protein MutS
MPTDPITPIRKQYLEIKKEYPNTILFFRLGDFYETFDHDAEITSEELDIVLTSRNVAKGQRVPMAGIPYHASDNYIGRLISKGYHVAICEQIGDQPENGLFPRKVVRVVTPGTVIEPGLLRNDSSNYLASIFISDEIIGFAYLEMTTGEFAVTEFEKGKNYSNLLAEISRINPSEILLPENLDIGMQFKAFLTHIPTWKFEFGRCTQVLSNQFSTANLDGFGLKNHHAAIAASGAALDYVKDKQPSTLELFEHIRVYSLADFMLLDEATRRNLELTENIRNPSEKGTLIHVIDKSITPMGKRLFRTWINQPLIDIQRINARLDLVESCVNDSLQRAEIRDLLKGFADIERIINRVISGHSIPRDLVSLRESLGKLPEITRLTQERKKLFIAENVTLVKCETEYDLLIKSISDDPPATLQNSGVIRPGYSEELDQLLLSTKHSRDWIANLEKNERFRTGIKTLKVGYNKVYGYYLEITKSYLNQVPEEYIRKQTLVNAERFITPELKEYESLVLNAEERIREIENRTYHEICRILAASSERILAVAKFIAVLDISISLAQTALENNYTRPVLFLDNRLIIKNGRHAVVEKTTNQISFVPNNTKLTSEDIIHIITGPNMSGKSTYLRQVALIVLLAQIGSYIPAEKAEIGVVDRIFTRIGAQDEIHAGQSTFMIEMTETANILHNATSRSLLILDEIGRGTSTYDGLSIAWSVLEYIHNHPELKARTLFATHYHELTQLPDIYPNMKNFNVAVSESGKEVVFLHKIIEGGADKSYGIHVAQLAGIPSSVIQRANSLLYDLENGGFELKTSEKNKPPQLELFPFNHPVIEELSSLDINSVSPIEALNKLYQWQKHIKSNQS